ncbi:hypothetical protein Aduo_019890 [Ancylostoma duodenale]
MRLQRFERSKSDVTEENDGIKLRQAVTVASQPLLLLLVLLQRIQKHQHNINLMSWRSRENDQCPEHVYERREPAVATITKPACNRGIAPNRGAGRESRFSPMTPSSSSSFSAAKNCCCLLPLRRIRIAHLSSESLFRPVALCQSGSASWQFRA